MLKMITRSGVKKSSANEHEVTKSVTKGKTRSTVKAKMDIQTPVRVHNDETNSRNVQLPVFNIHIHVPPMTINPNKSYQFQPAIHVHFGKLVKKLSSDAPSESDERPDKTSQVELPSGVNSNFDEQNNSLENMLLNPLKKNKVCKKLSFSSPKKNSANLKTEKSEAVLNSIADIQENEESLSNSFYKKQLPTRTSIRQANNRKLLKNLKDLNAKESIKTKTKSKKSWRNIKTENKSGSLGKTLNLKEPVVVLHDICKIMKKENFSFCDDIIGDDQEDCFSPINISACGIDSLENVDKLSCDSSGDNCNEQNSGNNIENEKNLKKIPDDLIPVNKKFGGISSLTSSSGNETSSASSNVTDFADKCTFSDNLKINLHDRAEPKKSLCQTPFNTKNIFVKDAENSQGNDSVFLQLEKHKVTEVENDVSNLLSKDKDVSLNLKNSDVNDGKSVNLNSKSKNSSGSSDDEFDSEDSGYDFSQTTNFEEGIHQSTSLKVLDMEKLNICSESKNNNLLKKIEENKLSSSIELDDCKEINTLGFQLKLIRKEMKKRDMVVKERSSRKKSLKKETASQITELISEKSPVGKKIKLSKKMTKSMPAASNAEKSPSPEDYIPLQVSGPTKFVVAQLSKVKPYSAHKAKNFKNEMLFGKRVNRYSDPKHLQTYLLKKQAAKIRNK